MNIGLVVAIVCGFVLMKFGLFGELGYEFFLDHHAMMVVFAGTLTAMFIATPLSNLARIGKGIGKMVFLGKQRGPEYIRAILNDVFRAAGQAKTDKNALGTARGSHPFLVEGFRLIADGLLSVEEMSEVLSTRIENYQNSYREDSKVLAGLAKFPPAFGLLGAVTGMIEMLSKLSEGGGTDNMGKALAVALVATFWGIFLANVIFLPLSDYYKKIGEDDLLIRRAIMDGVLMIKRREPIPLIEEKMNSYLPSQRRIRGGKVSEIGRKAG